MRRNVSAAAWLGVAAIAFLLAASQAEARSYTFTMTFVWEGANTVAVQLIPPVAIATAQISGPNTSSPARLSSAIPARHALSSRGCRCLAIRRRPRVTA